jgi:uncharacterized membrane protein
MEKYFSKFLQYGERPEIKIKKTPFDLCIEVVSLLIVLAHWFVVLLFYFKLPKIIPIHYNALGEIDGWGNKLTIFFSPVISVGLYIGITVAQRFPHIYNYATIEITEQNAPRLYQIAVRMMSIVKLLVMVMCMLTTMQVLQDALHTFEFVKFWMDWVVYGLMAIIIIYSVVKMYMVK